MTKEFWILHFLYKDYNKTVVDTNISSHYAKCHFCLFFSFFSFETIPVLQKTFGSQSALLQSCKISKRGRVSGAGVCLAEVVALATSPVRLAAQVRT